jgi:ABC-type Mn2+/Zn2+ transport system ATPase subunit
VVKIKPFTYQDEMRSFRNDLELDFSPYRVIAVAGPIGSGKSTFLKLFADSERHSLKITDQYTFCAYLSQDLTRLFTGNTLETILELYGNPHHIIGQNFDKKRFWDNLHRLKVPIESRMKEALLSFSEGELQRIAIALALATNGPLSILDEPTTALNPAYSAIFYRLLKERQAASRILLVSHRLQDIRCCAQAVLVIENMAVSKLLPLQQFLENEHINRYFPHDFEG